jgi:hypothetical protein
MNQLLLVFVGLFCLTLSISAQRTGIIKKTRTHYRINVEIALNYENRKI